MASYMGPDDRQAIVKRPKPVNGSYSPEEAQGAEIWAAVQSVDGVVERGHLEKLSGNGKYQKRYFILNGGFLMYWPNEKTQKTGAMPDAVLDLLKVEDVKHEGSTIEIKGPTVTFILQNTKPRKDKDEPVAKWSSWLGGAVYATKQKAYVAAMGQASVKDKVLECVEFADADGDNHKFQLTDATRNLTYSIDGTTKIKIILNLSLEYLPSGNYILHVYGANSGVQSTCDVMVNKLQGFATINEIYRIYEMEGGERSIEYTDSDGDKIKFQVEDEQSLTMIANGTKIVSRMSKLKLEDLPNGDCKLELVGTSENPNMKSPFRSTIPSPLGRGVADEIMKLFEGTSYWHKNDEPEAGAAEAEGATAKAESVDEAAPAGEGEDPSHSGTLQKRGRNAFSTKYRQREVSLYKDTDSGLWYVKYCDSSGAEKGCFVLSNCTIESVDKDGTEFKIHTSHPQKPTYSFKASDAAEKQVWSGKLEVAIGLTNQKAFAKKQKSKRRLSAAAPAVLPGAAPTDTAAEEASAGTQEARKKTREALSEEERTTLDEELYKMAGSPALTEEDMEPFKDSPRIMEDLMKRDPASQVKALLDKGADPNGHKYDLTGACALRNAAEHGNTPVLPLLLEAGALIDATDDDGDTALHSAAFEGKEDAVRVLLEAGADFKLKNADGGTPKFGASVMGNQSIVDLIEAHEAK